MTPAIAIVGMSCRFPDANSPAQLWENVLAGRRAFRRLPPERLRLEDYPLGSDEAIYSTEAAVIEGYEFDRSRFRVAGSTFRAADMAHWLALEVAADALADAGFAEGKGLPKEEVGVLLGNSLTGEFSRANLMRLRWPYVRRVVDAALARRGWSPEKRSDFLEDLQGQYKAPFPPVGDETLAGGLSNTIAGRICNHFDLGGGGYTIDGACSSSLLAVATACSALSVGDLDVALAGGVDLSLDPFELVGFSEIGALAAEEMRVYDAQAGGFWPGEGCGVLVLMRHEDALKQNRRIYALVRGWGISSDGSGGITRPEVAGQLLALRRAYRRAGFGIETVPYFEGHGTGTAIGDSTELRALSAARRERSPLAPPAVIGSIKANIGHTKAAAGAAGMIKAVLALGSQLLPPSTGWREPNPVLTEDAPALRLLARAEIWPSDQPLRAGVSAMGFGGINAHVVLEGVPGRRRRTITSRQRTLLHSAQDAELFFIAGEDRDALTHRVAQLASFAAALSRSELVDLAAALAKTFAAAAVRAAIVAGSPAELARGLTTLQSWLADGVQQRLDARGGVMLGSGAKQPAIGLLFPGQGSPANLKGGAWAGRFEQVGDLYSRADFPQQSDGIATEVAQPAIVTASLAGLHVLDQLGVQATVAIGHSLGELTAYHWAGAMDEDALLRLVSARGRAIADLGSPSGAMASIGAGADAVEPLLGGEPVVFAGLNSPKQTVVSGEAAAVEALILRAKAAGLSAVRLPVSHAFHSSLVAASTPALARAIAKEEFRRPELSVASTVTGALLEPDDDLGDLLLRQMISPVRFMQAIEAVADRIDLWIEVGPGRVLGGMARDQVDAPIVSLDAGGDSLRGLLEAVGAAFVLGAKVDHRALFESRFSRPLDLDWRPKFFVNPCELAPASIAQAAAAPQKRQRDEQPPHTATEDSNVRWASKPVEDSGSTGLEAHRTVATGLEAHRTEGVLSETPPLEVVRNLVARRAELPVASIKDDDRLLNDLHLSSLVVGQLVVEAARALGLSPPAAPTEAAGATVRQIAQALQELAQTAPENSPSVAETVPPGVDSWTRAFTVRLVRRSLPQRRSETGAGRWQVIAPHDHPLAETLRRAFGEANGKGVVVCLPPEPDERHVELLLEGAQAAAAQGPGSRFVMVQHGGGAAAFARSLHLELPKVTTCVVDVPLGHPQGAQWVLAESQAAAGYVEAHYDDAGVRHEPVLELLPAADEAATLPLDPDDVLLVTGGGKGIAAECAFALAKEAGLRLALLGRSEPSEDAELAGNLERMAAAGIDFQYIAADVTDRAAVEAAVRKVESRWGQVTAVLHGAGTNTPQRLSRLDKEAFLRTLRPKVQGLSNVLAAVSPEPLRLLVTFGSIIARTGMAGQADYAVANAWLTRLTERWQADHPHCRCLAVEWSVWSGIGMGERLGTIDALKAQGITPIPPGEGVRLLRDLIGSPPSVVPVVVTGRFGEPPTLKLKRPELPLLRFLERPRVHVPGVELVVEADLSADSDPYLKDHVYQDVPLFLAVMGLEAMAQVTMALTGSVSPPAFEQVKFHRPVVVPAGGHTTIRVAALVREPGKVELVLRSEETGFQMDHFRAICRVDGAGRGTGEPPTLLTDSQEDVPPLSIDPARDLYGEILFHTGRFKRLDGYRRLKATECIAEISAGSEDTWFGRYLPTKLVLGDPAARDAVIHAIQACVPHGTLLPIRVDRLVPAAELAGPLVVRAKERSTDGKTFIYDVEVVGPDGRVQERWEGLHLRRVGDAAVNGGWAAPLMGPYLERRVGQLLPGTDVSVAVERNGAADRRARSDLAIRRALGTSVPIHRRPDGRPEACCDREVSVSHAGDLAMAVSGAGTIACDAEPVSARPAGVWRDLLGTQRYALAELIAGQTSEDRDTAASRVWAAVECLKKAGASLDVPLVFHSKTADAWVLLAAGPLSIATAVMPVRGTPEKMTYAILVENDIAGL